MSVAAGECNSDSLKPRHQLIKRGRCFRRPLVRWCHVERGELVYFKSERCQHARGRIPLCEVFLDESPMAASCEIRIFANRGPCIIHLQSPDERAALEQYLRSMCAGNPSSSSDGRSAPSSPQMPAEVTAPQDNFEESDLVDPPAEMPLRMPPSVGSIMNGHGFQADAAGVQMPHERAASKPCEDSYSPQYIDMPAGDDSLSAGGASDSKAPLPPPLSPEGLPPHQNGGELHEHFFEVSLRDEEGEHGGTVPREYGSANGMNGATTGSLPYFATPARNVEGDECPDGRPVAAVAAEPDASYYEAVDLMWNYDLSRAERLLEPFRHQSAWHASAYAECSMLRVMLTGQRRDVNETMMRMQAAETLRDAKSAAGGSSPIPALAPPTGIARDVFTAELLLLRSVLQILMGSRIRGFLNLHQSWCLYRRLESTLIEEGGSSSGGEMAVWEGGFPFCRNGQVPVTGDAEEYTSSARNELLSRVYFGLGLFYLATSLVPRALGPLLRLAGFLIDRNRGKDYLQQCATQEGCRSTLAAVLLSLYHLDLEPNVSLAGELLMRFLRLKPECVLLHWAASVLAWRHSCISDAVELINKALWCCGEELSKHACYLRYELGMFHFMDMAWSNAHFHLRHVHDSVIKEKTFLPHKTLLSSQLAAVAFNMGYDKEGEALCEECLAAQDSAGASALERDFGRVIAVFLRHRTWSRRLLAFEVMYLLRQFSRLPSPMLEKLLARIRQLGQPYATQYSQIQAARKTNPGYSRHKCPDDPSEVGVLVEHTSALVMRAVVLFHLGDLQSAMDFIPELTEACNVLPPWCNYLAAHGLYWCGRIYSLNGCIPEAVKALRIAKGVKKYPFNISTKIIKVLGNVEQAL